MREIKFRAWLPAIKRMTYVHMLDELTNWNTKKDDNNTAIWLEFTGMRDKNGKEAFEDDIIKFVDCLGQTTTSRIRFGEYEQDGSGAEYMPTKCIGFYAERLKIEPIPGLDAYEIFEPDYEKTISILETKDFEVIGNIYENPDLLDEVGQS